MAATVAIEPIEASTVCSPRLGLAVSERRLIAGNRCTRSSQARSLSTSVPLRLSWEALSREVCPLLVHWVENSLDAGATSIGRDERRQRAE